MYKGAATQLLIDAYVEGARESGSVCHEVAIADLLFNYNKMFSSHMKLELETDLQRVVREMKWAHHVAVFCPAFESHIPAKLVGFFDRLFTPEEVGFGMGMNRLGDYFGKSARIVTILEEPLFNKWRRDPQINYIAIKRTKFERCRMAPVHTCTLGMFHQLDNKYAEKWVGKMRKFGQQGI